MAIQHKDIPEGHLHEPKGISLAEAGKIYIADGEGSGSWQYPVTYGKMSIIDSMEPYTYTNIIPEGESLETDQDYIDYANIITGTGAVWVATLSKGITFSVDKLTVPENGYYYIHGSNTAWYYQINGTSVPRPLQTSPQLGDPILLSKDDFVQVIGYRAAIAGEPHEITISLLTLTIQLAFRI